MLQYVAHLCPATINIAVAHRLQKEKSQTTEIVRLLSGRATHVQKLVLHVFLLSQSPLHVLTSLDSLDS